MAGWSSLAYDLVIEVGDRLLAAGDLDFYMNMRAVCRGWRDATDSPRANPADPRFLLRQWVLLDEKFPKRGDALAAGRLFLNTTGRSVRRELPCLPNHYFVTSTGGLLVMASRVAPHAVCVVNPITASPITFMAPIPDTVQHTTAYLHQVGNGISPTLVLEIGVSRDTAYSAQPDAELFELVEHTLLDKGLNIWGIDRHQQSNKQGIDGLISRILAVLPNEMSSIYPCCYFLGSPGDNLLVVPRQWPAQGVEVFKVDVETMEIRPTRCIGNHALLLGDNRCLSVAADKLHAVQGEELHSIRRNCIYYYVGGEDPAPGMCVYDLTNDREERLALFDAGWNETCIMDESVRPSMLQKLMNYCTDIKWTQIRQEQRYRQWQEIYEALLQSRA
ncbi:hypothetical protein VPH35_007247 [Triticum aestivum]